MSSSLLSSFLNGNFASAADRHLLHDDDDHFHHPTSRASSHNKGNAPVAVSTGGTSIPAVDILDTPKDYIFYVDVPGLSKSDIQVTVEDDNTLVIKSSSGKRKREADDDHGSKEEKGEPSSCKYIRLERRASHKFMRKFRLPEDSNLSAISAKCEDGVLTVTVEKLPPPPKPKTVQVTIS